MTAEIITVSDAAWKPEMSFEEYARTCITRTTDPKVVATHIVNRGEDEHGVGKIVLLDSDEEPAWWLDVAQALAIADRIRDRVQEILDGKPLGAGQ